MDYDVFISYRRDGGDTFAMMLKNELKERGFRVFHDVESLRSGDFNQQLYKEIEESEVFVLVLPPNALERSISDPNDWVRLEIEHALKNNKVIIPVMLRGFSFPENLPASLEIIRNFQGLEPRMDHTFQSSMEYLVSLICGKAGRNEENITIPMRSVRTFASCGLEESVLRVKTSSDSSCIELSVNFMPTKWRNEIPQYAGAYFLKQPAVDISRKSRISLEARSPDGSVTAIWIEIKPEGRKTMHESFAIDLSDTYQNYSIAISDFANSENAKRMEEITFVIKQSSFTNQECLQGKLDIRNLYIL